LTAAKLTMSDITQHRDIKFVCVPWVWLNINGINKFF